MKTNTYKLIKEYPGSPPIETIVRGVVDMGELVFPFVDEYIATEEILNYPEFWEPIEEPEVADSLEIRIGTNKGTKVFKSVDTQKLKNGYIFKFPSGKCVQFLVEEGDNGITI